MCTVTHPVQFFPSHHDYGVVACRGIGINSRVRSNLYLYHTEVVLINQLAVFGVLCPAWQGSKTSHDLFADTPTQYTYLTDLATTSL